MVIEIMKWYRFGRMIFVQTEVDKSTTNFIICSYWVNIARVLYFYILIIMAIECDLISINADFLLLKHNHPVINKLIVFMTCYISFQNNWR